MACMIGMLYRVKVINTVYSEMALARAGIAECLLVSSPHSDFSLMSPSWARQLNRRRMRMRNARAYISTTQLLLLTLQANLSASRACFAECFAL